VEKGKIKVKDCFDIDFQNSAFILYYDCKTCGSKYYQELSLDYFIDIDQMCEGLGDISPSNTT
jgi:hypothetical protein